VTAAENTSQSNERTALAWQRTALSLVVASVVLGRLTFARVGYLTVVLLAPAALISLWVFAESRWRYAQQRGLRHRSRPRGGRAAARLSLAAALLAVTEAVALARPF
jgi:uncharacterized membrane protein YidH (DUF202 family)